VEELELAELEDAQGLRAIRVTVDMGSREPAGPLTLPELIARGQPAGQRVTPSPPRRPGQQERRSPGDPVGAFSA